MTRIQFLEQLAEQLTTAYHEQLNSIETEIARLRAGNRDALRKRNKTYLYYRALRERYGKMETPQ